MSVSLLVVDDDKDILRLIQTLLSGSDYRVTTSAGAESALRVFREMNPPPDLVLTDVVMPGISGPMLADRLRALSPHLPVLFMSGFDHSHVVQRYVVQKGFDLIPKPFTAAALMAAIQKSLKSEWIADEAK